MSSLRCREDCCQIPVVPSARIHRTKVHTHRASRLDWNSSYWQRVRTAVPELTKDEIRLVTHLTVVDLPTNVHLPSPLQQQLVQTARDGLLRTAPQDQLQRSALVHGPPGSGKTHAVQATAASLGLKFLRVQYSDIHSKWVGESGKVLHAVFRLAWRHQPCILFLDECETLIGSRTTASGDDHDSPVTNELLTELQGSHTSQPGLIVFCCTNRLINIDSAALSRFGDRIFEAPPPDAATRRVIWMNALKDHDIVLTQAEIERLSEISLPSLRVISDAMFAFEKLETEDTSELLQIVQDRSAEPESDAELEEFPAVQHQWRMDASKYLKPQVPDLCTYISKRIHKAIPANIEDWQRALAHGGAQVAATASGSDSFELCLSETGRNWAVRTDQNIINVVLNFNTVNMYGGGGEQVRLLREELEESKEEVARLHEKTARIEQVLEESKKEVARSREETARIGQMLEEFIAGSRKRNQPTEPESVKRPRVGQSPRMFAGHEEEVTMTSLVETAAMRKDRPIALGLYLEDEQDIHDEEEEEEDESEAEEVMVFASKAKSRKNKKPTGQSPSCSRSHCSNMTQAMQNGTWKKQCQHCLGVSRPKGKRT
jgi:DNA polymerase III delta prime subunit